MEHLHEKLRDVARVVRDKALISKTRRIERENRVESIELDFALGTAEEVSERSERSVIKCDFLVSCFCIFVDVLQDPLLIRIASKISKTLYSQRVVQMSADLWSWYAISQYIP